MGTIAAEEGSGRHRPTDHSELRAERGARATGTAPPVAGKAVSSACTQTSVYPESQRRAATVRDTDDTGQSGSASATEHSGAHLRASVSRAQLRVQAATS